MTEEKITPADLLGLNKQLQKINEDDTPFAVVKDDEIAVVGDANKTEVKKNDYTVKFRVPISMFQQKPADAVVVGSSYVFSVDFPDVTISPRSDLIIVDAIMKITPFFKKLNENGSVDDLTNEELLSVFAYAGEEVHLAIYNLVATFLQIGDEIAPYMLPFSVIGALNEIIENHPEVFNEADAFFG